MVTDSRSPSMRFGPVSTPLRRTAPGTICLISTTTADRRLVGTSIAAVSEEASGILSGDAVESGSERLLQCLNSARGDPAEVGFHLGPSGFDRAEVRTVGRQIAIGKA